MASDRNRSPWGRLYERHPQTWHETQCVYCGRDATCLDHFLPIAHLRSVYQTAQPLTLWPLLFKVPACAECNGIAGDHVFRTYAQKRDYIRERLRRRYRKLLDRQRWDEEEIIELGPSLQQFVRARQRQRAELNERLHWSLGYQINPLRWGER